LAPQPNHDQPSQHEDIIVDHGGLTGRAWTAASVGDLNYPLTDLSEMIRRARVITFVSIVHDIS
jgi:hypothetical protein